MVHRHYTGPVVGLLAGVALFVLPGASASPASQSVYVGNAGSTVTSYPTSASGNSAPSASLSEGGNVGSLAFDSSGELWVGSGPGAGATNGVLSEYTPSELESSGSPAPTVQITSSAVGVNTGAAFDSSGDLWLACQGCHSFSEFASSQLASSGTKAPALTIGTGTASPNGIAIDEHGDVWVSSFNEDTLSEYTPGELGSSGTPAPAVVISATGGSLSAPARLAFDGAGDLWAANNGDSTVVEFTAAELASSGTPAPAVVLSSTASKSLDGPNALGFDGSGDLWVVDETSNTLVEFSHSELASSGAPTPVDTIAGLTTGIDNPWVLAIGAIPAPGAIPTAPTSESGSPTGVSASSSGPPIFSRPPAPSNMAPPTLSGSRRAGYTLTCSRGTWTNNPTGFSYQWTRDGKPIATGPTYVVHVTDESQALTCTVTASNAGGSASASASVRPPPGARATGYWLVASNGGIFAFGRAHFYGSAAGTKLSARIVGMAATADGKGYWLVASDGGVFSFGDAHSYGSTGNVHLAAPIVGMAATADGKGYWLVASDGGVFPFGDARFYGSTSGVHLTSRIVGMAATADGKGYWLVASDGGVFPFGDAHFYGDIGNVHLAARIVGMAATPDGQGYWLVASDGGVFSFGDARFYGSVGGIHLTKPVVGMAASPNGKGYWLAGSDGGEFVFGSAHFYGSTGGIHLTKPVVGMAVASAPGRK